MPPANICRLVARRTLVGLALVLAAPGCGSAGSKESWAAGKQGDRKKTAVSVAVAKLEARRIERYYRTSGTLSAIQAADIVATQLAVIKGVSVEEGDIVQKGQSLVRLDGRELALQAASSSLQLRNLQSELQRLESVQAGAISSEEIDKQRYAVEEARAAAKLSRHQSKQTIVRAPFTGTVIQRHVDPGNLATTATVLLSIADLRTLELELHIPERDASKVKKGTDVDIELVDGSTFTAQVTRRAPVVDATTGTVRFTVQTSDFPAGATPGAFARARVLIDARETAPSVPSSAVFEVEGAPHVYTIVDGKARRTAVKLGLDGGDFIEVLEGLTLDDTVVTDGGSGITEGMPLKPAEVVTETPGG